MLDYSGSSHLLVVTFNSIQVSATALEMRALIITFISIPGGLTNIVHYQS